MIGYIGVVYSSDETDIQKIHDKTYSAVKVSVPDSVYNSLISNVPLRIKAYMEPNYFYSLLDFYKVKPLYTWLIYLLQVLGLNIVLATVIPSIISFLLLMIIVFYWISHYLPAAQTLIVSSIVAVIKPISDLAKFSTPDLLSTFFLLVAFYLVAQKRNNIINLSILFILSVLSRMDNIVFWMVLLIFLIILNNNVERKKIYAVSAVSAITFAFLLFVLLFDKNLGWYKKYFEFMFETDYLYNIKVILAVFKGSLLFYSICVSFLIFILNSLKPASNKMHFLFVVSLICVAAKFILFPHFEERFYMVHTIFFIIFIVYSVAEIKSAYRNILNEPGKNH